MLHYEILDDTRTQLLKCIDQKPDLLKGFYLAGGTALSLQEGYRCSYDFDFFSRKTFNENEIAQTCSDMFGDRLTSVRLEHGTCDIVVDTVKLSFLHYPYKLVDNTTRPEEFTNLRLASIRDIATMKVAAIGGRGARKDFFDLYHILNDTSEEIQTLAKDLVAKFGIKTDYSYMVMGLDYFEDAEMEILPKTFVKENWDQIKKFFSEEKEHFAEAIVQALHHVKILGRQQQER